MGQIERVNLGVEMRDERETKAHVGDERIIPKFYPSRSFDDSAILTC
jgi:hypothetical protein